MKNKFENLITLSAVSIALLSPATNSFANESSECLNISGSWNLKTPACFIPAWQFRFQGVVTVRQNQTLEVSQKGCESFTLTSPASLVSRDRTPSLVKNYHRPIIGVKQMVTMTDSQIETRSRDFDPAGIGLYGPFPANVYEYLAKYKLSDDQTTLRVEITRVDNGVQSYVNECNFERKQ